MSNNKKRKMVNLLLSSSVGKIVACNIIDAIDHNVVTDHDVIKEFMDAWYSEFKKSSSDSVKELIGLITTTARKNKESGSGNFYGSGHKPASNNDDIKFHHITTYGSLLRNIDKLKLQKSLGPGSTILPSNVDIGSPALHRFMKRYAFIPFKTTSATGSIGPPNECFWVTTDSEIKDNLALEIKDRADSIRNLLGLVHYQPVKDGEMREQPILMSIILDEKLLRNRRSRPCFIDAKTHPRFRTFPDEEKNKKDKEWGYSVNLKKLEGEKPPIDGARENVVRSIECSMMVTINILAIGIVLTEIGNENKDTDALANLMMSNRDRAVLKERLLDLL